MKKNMKNKKSQTKFLCKITICFASLLIIFLFAQGQMQNGSFVVSANDTTQKEYCYLSDIPYVKEQSKVGWGTLTMNQASNGSLLSVKVEGAYYEFEKGIWAHATSTVVYDLTQYNQYDYFTAYIGLNKTAASSSNGVKFYVYTSTDGNNWDLKTESEPAVKRAGDNATFVKIPIKDVKYLKLYANDNGANGNDHAVYADAKLITADYKEEAKELVPSIEKLDQKIKTQFANADLSNQEYELTLLQRKFVKNAGEYALTRFINESEKNKQVFSWLVNNVENLRLYVLGGAPEGGSYYNSLTQLSRLYDEYSSDFTNSEPIHNPLCPTNMTIGYLYKKMAISLSLTHSQTVGLWMQSSMKENQSDALRRYAIFKYLYKNGKLKVSDTLDYTKWFEALEIEEMRFIMNNHIDDEEILWLNAYVQTKIDETGATNWLTPHPHIAYVWPNYQNEVYYDENNKNYFNELFAAKKEKTDETKTGLFDLVYTIPGGKNNSTYQISVTRGNSEYKLYKVWMNFRNKFGTGAVCGGISKSGSNIRTTHGIPATVIGQPGHAALLYYTMDAQGRGYWNIDNDVSGWTLSEKGERMLLGWGNANYSKGYSVVYMALAQEAINDYDNLTKCEETIMIAESYEGDLKKQEEFYRKALAIQPFNIDAWYGLIGVYNANEKKTENQYYELAEELAENLKCFPLPMQHLTNLIKPKLTSIENSYKFTLLQTRILTEGSNLPNNTDEKYYVYQPSLTRVEANYLLGKLDKTIATFSFDGEDAGKIVLANRFDNNGIRWDYSIDGKQTWKEVSFTAEEEHKWSLTQQEINSITSENDIYVHIVGVNYEENNLYKIDIKDSEGLPATLYANDLENKLIGAIDAMQWKYSKEDGWTSYKIQQPDLTGDKTVIVRVGATGVYLASESSETYTFTQNNEPDNRKYVPISHLSIQGVSTEATAQGRHAQNAIDGNINTNWHSAWNGSDKEKYITIQLDEPKYLTSLEYFPVQGGNGKIKNAVISVSMDGENWTEVVPGTDWAYNMDTKRVDFEATQAQYIKIVGKETQAASSSLSFIAVSMFNLFEDATKGQKPTAEIQYDITTQTTENVTAKLINPSTEITITNNHGSDTYVFKENGEFTFEFKDKNGNTGTATAKVNWIVKRPDQSENPEQPDKPSQPEQPDNPDVPDKPNKPSQPEQPGNPDTPNKPSNPDQSKGITSEKYQIQEKYISRIAPNTTVNQFKQKVKTEQKMIFIDSEGKTLGEDDLITTDTILKVGDNLQYSLIVIGDVDGDGEITINDLAKIKLHIIEIEPLEGTRLQAADVDDDGEVTINDLAQVKLVLIDLMEIK